MRASNETRWAHQRERIVILGGGFGGVYTALNLEKRIDPDEVEIVLVSRDNYFLMTPLLFEAGSGVLEARHAVSPIRTLLKHTRFIEAEIEAIDFDGRVVYARHSPSATPYELAYDQLVLGLGGVTNRRLIPGSETALGFKTLADAIGLRNHLIDLFERADVETDPEALTRMLSFVVIGGGLVGIELMGEMTHFLENACRAYPRVACHRFKYYVIEALPRILTEMDEDLAEYAQCELEARGVKFLTGTAVAGLAPGLVSLPDGRLIHAGTVVLAAGVSPNPLMQDFPLTRDRRGKLVVEATMRSVDRPEVWAIGDCASIPGPDGKPYPPLAQHAIREAKVLARNILAAMRGDELEPFIYESKGTLAALGEFSGVGKLGKHVKIRGFLAWWVWRTYYLFQMPRFERKLRILLDWTVSLFFKYDVVKLDFEPAPGVNVAPSPERRETRDRRP